MCPKIVLNEIEFLAYVPCSDFIGFFVQISFIFLYLFPHRLHYVQKLLLQRTNSLIIREVGSEIFQILG